ncbi:hypothetical protein GCM10020370_72180 [Paenibacillus hodogayensis]
MNNTRKHTFAKAVVVASMSLSMMFSGSLFLTSNSAHAATVSSSSLASNIISTGQQFMGVPYKFGSKTGNTSTFDCSSFTQYVYKLNGVSIPRSSRQQSTAGTYVPRDQLQPGDLVFFYSPIHHVAIYMGNGKILHTYGKGGVTISDLNSGNWNRNYNTARRVLPSNGQVAAQPAPNNSGSVTKPDSVKKSNQGKPSQSSGHESDNGNDQGEH